MAKRVFSGVVGSPLSKGIVSGGLLFLSGQVAGADGGETIESQTAATLHNVARALEDCGSSVDRVLKCTIFMTDLAGKSAMNEIYQEFFSGNLPARTTVGISDLGEGILIEIDVVAEVAS